MCGIAGIVVRADASEDKKFLAVIAAMTDHLVHRGPDDHGQAVVDAGDPWRLYLGHRRLSILDVSANGRQPMHEPATGSWLTYNGEVYNHHELREPLVGVNFRSTSDTESLLQGWVNQGPDIVTQLRGIFAFALFDGTRNELWIVRDRLGVKPLYFAFPRPGLFLFASEVRAILASELISRQLSQSGLATYLSFGSVQAPETMIEGVRSLLPGELVRFRFESQHTLEPTYHRYWQLNFAESTRPVGGNTVPSNGGIPQPSLVVDQIRPVFDEAVRLRFLSDVPVGVFLSGGVDSSAVVASAARQELQPATFSIAFAEEEFDESQHAQAVAQLCGVEHTKLCITPEMMLAEIGDALAAYDQPSGDGLNTYMISKAAHEAGLKVAISGLGGDEVFAGYPSFRRLPLIERWYPRLGLQRDSPWRPAASRAFAHSNRIWRAVQLAAFSRSRLDIYRVLRQFFSAETTGRLMVRAVQPSGDLPHAVADELSDRSRATDPINAVSLLELSLYLPNTLLRDTDQMSMAHGLEVRVPLLDHRMIERLAALSGSVKKAAKGAPNKWLLVELARDFLPRASVDRRRMGFVFPWERWLRDQLRELAEQFLLDRSMVEAAGLESREVTRLWQDFQRGRAGLRYADMLTLLNLVHWCHINGVTA